MAAGFGAQAMGATLENLTPVAFACGVWTMICGSLGWLIFTLLFTDKMDKVNHLMSKGNSKMVPIISAGAMLGAFANLASGNFFNEKNQFAFGGAPAIATIVGCILMDGSENGPLQFPCSQACSLVTSGTLYFNRNERIKI